MTSIIIEVLAGFSVLLNLAAFLDYAHIRRKRLLIVTSLNSLACAAGAYVLDDWRPLVVAFALNVVQRLISEKP